MVIPSAACQFVPHVSLARITWPLWGKRCRVDRTLLQKTIRHHATRRMLFFQDVVQLFAVLIQFLAMIVQLIAVLFHLVAHAFRGCNQLLDLLF